MANPFVRIRWRPSPATLIASGVVILGFVLTGISWGFLVLVAVGTFGPGILRELGWLKDKDEFERRVAHRAGYHAYLVGGFITFLIVAYMRSGEREIGVDAPVSTLILVVLWFTWLLSSLLSYWGPRKTASRILIIFGSVWLLFNIIGNIEAGPVALIMQSSLAAPFFILAYVAHRWPRVAGVLLIAASAFFVYVFDWYEIFCENPFEKGPPVVIILFVGPLLASGIALLSKAARVDADVEQEDLSES